MRHPESAGSDKCPHFSFDVLPNRKDIFARLLAVEYVESELKSIRI